MSLAPLHTPTHQFTSTIDHHHQIVFNVWVVIVTAVIFFIILSWYNALLSVYNYAIGYNPNEVCDYNDRNKQTMFATIGYAIIWTGLALSVYICLACSGRLQSENIGGHPLLRGESEGLARTGTLAAV